MYIVAEIAQAHDGSLGNAISFAKESKKAGADAIKIQIHLAEQESTRKDRFRVNTFPQDKTRFEYWERTSFTKSEWTLFAEACKECGIDLIVSPFSSAACDVVPRELIYAFKIGSGECLNYELIRACTERCHNLIVSSGMSTWDELERSYRYAKHLTSEVSVLQCTSKYPTPLGEVSLPTMKDISDRLGCRSGLSDHTGDPDVAKAALCYGAEIVEVHVCWDKRMFGPDSSSSLTIDELSTVCAFRDKLGMINRRLEKDEAADALSEMKLLFGRSLVSARSLDSGHILTRSDIEYKKPGGGLDITKTDLLIGKCLKTDIGEDHVFTLGEIE